MMAMEKTPQGATIGDPEIFREHPREILIGPSCC